MRIEAEIEYDELEGEYCPVEGVRATCERCGHFTESFGTSEASILRCLALLNEECPEEENNLYIAAEESGVSMGRRVPWTST